MIKKKLLVIIPARKGSKGIKDKNIFIINKKPLIYYSIIASNFIKERNKIVICCTDSKKISKISKSYGAEVPFLRPKNISQDSSLDIEFVNFCLKKFYEKGIVFNYGLILRPTSPIRKKKILNTAYNLFIKNKKASSLRAITESPITPYKMWRLKKNFISPIMKNSFYEGYNMPRQQLPKVYWQTGNFEFFRINFSKKILSISGKKIIGFAIKGDQIIDIDNLDDLKLASKILISKYSKIYKL